MAQKTVHEELVEERYPSPGFIVSPKTKQGQQLIQQAKKSGLIPEEAKVTGIKRTPEGYEIEYTLPFREPTPLEVHFGAYEPMVRTPAGMAEYILSEMVFRRVWDPAYRKRLEELERAYEKRRRPEERRYIARLAGYQVETAMAIGGLVAGTYYIAKGLAPVVRYGAGAKIPKQMAVVAGKTEALKATVARAVKFGTPAKAVHKMKLAVRGLTPRWRARLEEVLIKRVPLYRKQAMRQIARGEVALPQIPERIGLAELKAQKLAWELTQVPRTGGVWLKRVGVAPAKAKVMKHLFFRAGKLTIGYLREPFPPEEPVWRRGLLPYVTQKQVARLGITPYIPKVATARVITEVEPQVPVAVPTTYFLAIERLTRPAKPKRKERQPRLIAPIWQPTYALEKEKFRPLTLRKPRLRLGERRRTVPIVQPVQIQPQIPKRVARLKLKQKLFVPPKVPLPLRPKQPTKRGLLMFYAPGPFPTFGAEFERLFGKWFYRRHPIATPGEVVRRFMGLRRRRKRKARRKRKVKTRKGGR